MAVFRLALTLLLALLLGCERAMPPLVDVFEVGPRTLERHERIEIHGSGFPPGRTATVVFHGTVNAPGERPDSVDIVADGKVTSDELLVVPFDETLESRFAARGGPLRHGTFHGSVTVRFAALGGSPVHGTRDDVELDVRPKVRLEPEADERGQAVLAKLGATSDEALVLGELAPGGVAEAHGLLAGDRVVEFAGVRVHGAADLSDQNVPRPLVIRTLRAGESDEHVISIEAPPFARPVPRWLSFATIGLGAFGLVAALLSSRRLTRVRRWELALGALLRTRTAAERVAPRTRARSYAWLAPLALVTALAVAPLSSLGAELDVPTLFVAWLAARIVLARPSSTTRGALRVSGWLVAVLASVVPLTAVVALGVHATAALRVVDVSAAQGSWNWLALQSPWMTVAAGVVLVSPSPGRSPMHWLADALGIALLVLLAFGGFEPFSRGLAMPVAFGCKVVVVLALQRGLRIWSERAGGLTRHAGFAAPAVAIAATAGHFALGTPVWLAAILSPALLVLATVVVVLMVGRATLVPAGPADELDPA